MCTVNQPVIVVPAGKAKVIPTHGFADRRKLVDLRLPSVACTDSMPDRVCVMGGKDWHLVDKGETFMLEISSRSMLSIFTQSWNSSTGYSANVVRVREADEILRSSSPPPSEMCSNISHVLLSTC